jgi:hypothetical protein
MTPAPDKLPDMLGRVNSSMYLVSMSLVWLAPLTSGLLIEHFSGQWAMAAPTTRPVIGGGR